MLRKHKPIPNELFTKMVNESDRILQTERGTIYKDWYQTGVTDELREMVKECIPERFKHKINNVILHELTHAPTHADNLSKTVFVLTIRGSSDAWLFEGNSKKPLTDKSVYSINDFVDHGLSYCEDDDKDELDVFVVITADT